jgi:hypothetical protein
MRAVREGCTLLLPFKMSIGICCLFIVYPAHAEYYFVSPAAPRVIWLDGSHHHAVIKKKKAMVRKRYKHPVSHKQPRIEVYYVNYVYPYPPCCACQEVWIQGRWDCYGGCGARPTVVWQYRDDGRRYETRRVNYTYYPREEITYNPDRTTGDDDTWVNPDMDIDE